MNLFNYLPKEDVHLFWQYLDAYSDGESGVLPLDRMDYFLRYWDEAKTPFFDMFDHKFIIKKEISFGPSEYELADNMESAFGANPIIRNFLDNYTKSLCTIFENDYYIRPKLYQFVYGYKHLVNNIYPGPSFTIDGEYTKDGRPFKVNAGCKMIKMLGKIIKALGISSVGYEELRQAHSLVLNQKKIKGNLCLSIHPLDFITMSDNASGWDSCMRWIGDCDPGDYRLGTIEMMNSPWVVIAYIEAKEPMKLEWGATWNNKRWRQLFIVTRDLILGNRQYPYSNDCLQGAAIQWLRELCQRAPGWGPYEETSCMIENHALNTIKGRSIYFNIDCNYMYNDVYDERLAYLSKNFNDYDSDTFSLNFSGPAICTACGIVIEPDTIDASQVQCSDCGGGWICACCGDSYDYHSDWIIVDGQKYCEYCADEYAGTCECCEDLSATIEHIPISISNPTQNAVINSFDRNYGFNFCSCCLASQLVKNEFGPIVNGAFNIDNISDDGFDYGDFYSTERSALIKLRDTKDISARIKIITDEFEL